MNLDKLYETLQSLRTENGLYLASTGQFYQKVWVRDTFYCALPLLKSNPQQYVETYHTLLDYYINIEEKFQKLTWLIKQPSPKEGYRYPHPRLTIELGEIYEPWGNKQLDCFGEILFGIWLGEKNGHKIIRNEKDRNIINLLIKTLESLEYWNDKDNGIWEENEEIHVSSISACLAGLTAIKILGFEVNPKLLDEAHRTLNRLLPRESESKEVDLAEITLIYPFNIIDTERARVILSNIENKLLRERGVIRYIGDRYYNSANKEEHIKCNRYYNDETDFEGNEAEWTFGLAFLALSYMQYGDYEKAKTYLDMLEKCIINDNVPELFYSRTDIANDNNPLGWSVAMAILAFEQYKDKEWRL